VVRLSSVVVNITGHVLPKVRLKGEVLKVFSSSGHRPSCRAMTATARWRNYRCTGKSPAFEPKCNGRETKQPLHAADGQQTNSQREPV